MDAIDDELMTKLPYQSFGQRRWAQGVKFGKFGKPQLSKLIGCLIGERRCGSRHYSALSLATS